MPYRINDIGNETNNIWTPKRLFKYGFYQSNRNVNSYSLSLPVRKMKRLSSLAFFYVHSTASETMAAATEGFELQMDEPFRRGNRGRLKY